MQIFRRFLAVGLVFGIKFVTEGFCFRIHDDNQLFATEFFDKRKERVEESEDNVAVFPFGSHQRRADERKISAVNQTVAVD